MAARKGRTRKRRKKRTARHKMPKEISRLTKQLKSVGEKLRKAYAKHYPS